MIDRREEILNRLMVIFGSVAGVVAAKRNQENVSGRRRPAVIMHDAAEETAEFVNRPRGSTKDYVNLSPQIYLLLGAPSDSVGTEVSQFRAVIIPAVLLDDTLRQLCGCQISSLRGGDIRYTGCGLDTTTGETREARLELKFEFTYPLDCTELQP